MYGGKKTQRIKLLQGIDAATNVIDLIWLEEDIPTSIFDIVLRELVVPS